MLAMCGVISVKSFRVVPAACVLIDEYETLVHVQSVRAQHRAVGIGAIGGDAVRGARWKLSRAVTRRIDGGKELYAIAHGNSDFALFVPGVHRRYRGCIRRRLAAIARKASTDAGVRKRKVIISRREENADVRSAESGRRRLDRL